MTEDAHAARHAHGAPRAPRTRGPVPIQLSTVRPGAQRKPADLPRLRWEALLDEQPQFAELIRTRFEQQAQHVLATLTVSGSPRVSGTEVFWFGGDVWIGSRPQAGKAQDLGTDPRFVLHVNPGDGSKREGDVKISGIVEPVVAGQDHDSFVAAHAAGRPVEVFRLLLEQIVHTQVSDDGLRITTWNPGRELSSETQS